MKIIKKEVLTSSPETKITKFEVHSPLIAKKAKPGQFVALMVSEEGERVPLTLVDTDPASGNIVIMAQELGFTTKILGRLKEHDFLYSLVGPLGHPTEIKNYGRVILVGGGVGIAEIYPVAKALKKASNHVTTILGARTRGILILESEMRAVSDELYITTDDGSHGRKGFTTDVLDELLKKSSYNLVYGVGPIPMMKRVSSVTKPFGVRTLVSLNAIMVDATGMCGCCRVDVGGNVKFSCVDGPEFDGHLVDWDGLTKRNRVYTDKETHICKLNNLS